MGTIDYLLRNCISKSLIYITVYILIISLIFLDYVSLETIEAKTLSDFVLSNSISSNIEIFRDSLFIGFENKFILALFFLGLLYINASVIFILIIHWKEINLTYALNLFQNIKNYWWQKDKQKISHDRFLKSNRNNIYYENSISIDISKYEDLTEQIIQYLKLPNDYEINITRYKRKGVQLEFYHLPKFIEFDITYLEKNKIFLGFSKDGKHLINLTNLTHLGIVGESGSGKSNLLNMILLSIIYNIDKFEHLFLIDLKGVELARYEKHPKVSFVDNINNVMETLKKLKEIMYQRYKEMKEKELLKYEEEYILLLIDEVGTLSTAEKKIKDQINLLLIELFQKGRACNIFIHVYAQKFDSTQLSSNVLSNLQGTITLKTDSDYNVNITLGKKELVEKITKVDIDSFNHGRAIFKDGTNSEKILIQVPFVKYIDYQKVININNINI